MLELSKEAFALQDWVTGAETGGVEAPRKIVGIEQFSDGSVSITWRNPETCGLSDCRYHYTDTDLHISEYRRVGNQLYVNGDTSFVKWVSSVCRDKVLAFCHKYGLEMPQTT